MTCALVAALLGGANISQYVAVRPFPTSALAEVVDSKKLHVYATDNTPIAYIQVEGRSAVALSRHARALASVRTSLAPPSKPQHCRHGRMLALSAGLSGS